MLKEVLANDDLKDKEGLALRLEALRALIALNDDTTPESAAGFLSKKDPALQLRGRPLPRHGSERRTVTRPTLPRRQAAARVAAGSGPSPTESSRDT